MDRELLQNDRRIFLDRDRRGDELMLLVDLEIVGDARFVIPLRLVEALDAFEIGGEAFGIETGPLAPRRIPGPRLGLEDLFDLAGGKMFVAVETQPFDGPIAGGIERFEGNRVGGPAA